MVVYIVLAETEQLGSGVQAMFNNSESAEQFREIREKSETIQTRSIICLVIRQKFIPQMDLQKYVISKLVMKLFQ